MSTLVQPEPRPRRAILAAALGGAAAFVANAVARPGEAAATQGQPVLAGELNTATNSTVISTSGATAAAIRAEHTASDGNTAAIVATNASGSGVAVSAAAETGFGVAMRAVADGSSGTGIAVDVRNPAGATYGVRVNVASAFGTGVEAIMAGSGSTVGVDASVPGDTSVAVRGAAGGGSIGVEGRSGSGSGVHGAATSGHGVHGDATTGHGVHGAATSGPGVFGESTNGDGVQGAATTGVGVHGAATSGRGVFGESTSGNSVHGTASVGHALHGEATTGVGVYAAATSGLALSVTGRAQFSRSGRVFIAAGASTVDVTVPGGSLGSANVLAMLQAERSGVWVIAARPNFPTTGQVRIYLNKAASQSQATPLAWFVFG